MSFDDGRSDVPGGVAGPVGVGGSWIHMPGGNPMSAFAQQVGVPRRGADPVPEMAGFDCAEGRRLSDDEARVVLGLYDEVFPEATARRHARCCTGPGPP